MAWSYDVITVNMLASVYEFKGEIRDGAGNTIPEFSVDVRSEVAPNSFAVVGKIPIEHTMTIPINEVARLMSELEMTDDEVIDNLLRSEIKAFETHHGGGVYVPPLVPTDVSSFFQGQRFTSEVAKTKTRKP